ncbi:hypothetical protein DF186_15725, partial [Enterococcus hirae]
AERAHDASALFCGFRERGVAREHAVFAVVGLAHGLERGASGRVNLIADPREDGHELLVVWVDRRGVGFALLFVEFLCEHLDGTRERAVEQF